MKIAMMLRSFLEVPVPTGVAYSPATIAQSLAEGLDAAGHQVTFYGPEGTDLRVSHVETHGFRPFFKTMEEFDEQVSTTDLFNDYRFAVNDLALARHMLEAAQAGEFDLVIFHHFESAVSLAPLFPDVPVVFILHDYMDEERVRMLETSSSANQYFISISDSQRKFAPDLNYAATVYNGVDTKMYTPNGGPAENDDEYLLFSGRISQEKGVREAVQVAIQTNQRLLIAGNLSKQDFWYFDEHVKPYLDDKILFLGMLGKEQLIKYYQRAKALLVPIQWEEPFGLTMAEANACGTPVIAFRRGSVPEVIENGKNGYIVNNSAEMILALDKIDKIKRKDCREHVVDNFSVERMVEHYGSVFQKIVNKKGSSEAGSTERSSIKISKNLSRISKRFWHEISQ